MQRGRLAELSDCYLGCECCGDDVICQILLDKLLYDVDRAIDLYTLGIRPAGDGEPEWRAAAYGVLIQQFVQTQGQCLPSTPCAPALGDPLTGLSAQLSGLQTVLLGSNPIPAASTPPAQQALWMRDELCLQQLSDARLESILATLAPGCIPAQTALNSISVLVSAALTAIHQSHPCSEPDIEPPPTTESSLRIFYRADQAIDRFLPSTPPRPAS